MQTPIYIDYIWFKLRFKLAFEKVWINHQMELKYKFIKFYGPRNFMAASRPVKTCVYDWFYFSKLNSFVKI